MVNQLLSLRRKGIMVDECFLMLHGSAINENLEIRNEDAGTVESKTTSELCIQSHDFFCSGNVHLFMYRWIYCGSVHLAENHGDALFERVMGTRTTRSGSVTFCTNNVLRAVTLNYHPQDNVTIHSGLNPEILEWESFRLWAIDSICNKYPNVSGEIVFWLTETEFVKETAPIEKATKPTVIKTVRPGRASKDWSCTVM